ncbi:unnamed protein product, partial [Ilex paraguariensis]
SDDFYVIMTAVRIVMPKTNGHDGDKKDTIMEHMDCDVDPSQGEKFLAIASNLGSKKPISKAHMIALQNIGSICSSVWNNK